MRVVLGSGAVPAFQMQFMRRLLVFSGGVALLILVIGVFLPSRANIEREITIDANPATVFSLLNDFGQVNKWSPWLERDPNVRYSVSGPGRGDG